MSWLGDGWVDETHSQANKRAREMRWLGERWVKLQQKKCGRLVHVPAARPAKEARGMGRWTSSTSGGDATHLLDEGDGLLERLGHLGAHHHHGEPPPVDDIECGLVVWS